MINIFSIEDFVKFLKSQNGSSFRVNVKILDILRCYEAFKNNQYQDNFFTLKLNTENIFHSFYENEIIHKLNVLSIKDIESQYINQNELIYFQDEPVKILKTKIILFVLDYILMYLAQVLYEIRKDVKTLLDVYKFEARLELNENKQLSDDILNAIKNIKREKYKKTAGRKNEREMLLSDNGEFVQACDLAEEAMEEHKTAVDDIIKNAGWNKNLALKHIEEYCNSDGVSSLAYGVISIYAKEKLYNNSTRVKLCIYKFLDKEFNLGFFNENIDDLQAFDNFQKWLRRKSRSKLKQSSLS